MNWKMKLVYSFLGNNLKQIIKNKLTERGEQKNIFLII